MNNSENDLEGTLSTLKDKVSQFTNSSSSPTFSKSSNILSKIGNKFYLIVAILIPIVCIIVLVIIRPKFMMREIISLDGSDVHKYKINPAKLAITALIASILGWLLLFSYFYKKRRG